MYIPILQTFENCFQMYYFAHYQSTLIQVAIINIVNVIRWWRFCTFAVDFAWIISWKIKNQSYIRITIFTHLHGPTSVFRNSCSYHNGKLSQIWKKNGCFLCSELIDKNSNLRTFNYVSWIIDRMFRKKRCKYLNWNVSFGVSFKH